MYTRILIAIVAAGALVIRAEDGVRVMDTPDTAAKPNVFYPGNREPLLPSPLIKLPIGAIKPQGWLRKQLELEANGFSGHLTEISSFCNTNKNAWLSPEGIGGNGWEEVPYWFRGFCALGYVLDDQRIIAESKEWLEAVIASSREDGFFGPRSNFKQSGDHDMMPNMSMMFALRAHYEYTGDKRVIELLRKYFKWQLQIPDKQFFSGGWQVPRNGDNMDSVYWLFNITGDTNLLALADKLRRTGTSWMKEPTGGHNVDFSMGWRKPAQFYPQNKDINYLKQAERNYDSIYNIYGQFPGGLFAGDEFMRPGFTDPRNAIETCGIVDMMLSEEILLRITGDVKWADRCENAAYNSLPAALTADMKGLRYLTSVNQIVSDRRNKAPELADQGDMQSMNPHSHRCCQHNVAMGWPLFTESLWHATPGNGLAATFYNACTVKAKVGDGTEVTIAETTQYPFDGVVNLAFNCAKPVQFPLYLIVPGWSVKPQVSINGKPVAFEGKPSSYICIDRTWVKGDTLVLTLPMEVSVKRWEKQKNSASVNRGPLSFSVKIGEQYTKLEPERYKEPWPAWEIAPTTPWNYGLVLASNNTAASFEVVKKQWPASNMVFTLDGTPVEIKAKVKLIPNWTDTGMGLPGKLQRSPIKSAAPVETITLVPMGAARLRIASFPVIGDGPDAREWQPTEPMPASYWANPRMPELLRDGRVPVERSRDIDCFRWVGWAMYNTGAKVWARQDFEQEETIASCEIFWAQGGSLSEPEWWKLYYLAGNDWKEVAVAGNYTYTPNAFGLVSFKPVKTRALKIEAQTRNRASAGMYEWRSWAQAAGAQRHSVYQSFGPDIMGDAIVKTVSVCEVTWHVDAENPKSAVPKSWKLFARNGDEPWKAVATTSNYGLDADKANVVSFTPVTATAMKMEIVAAPGVSAGPREWRIKNK